MKRGKNLNVAAFNDFPRCRRLLPSSSLGFAVAQTLLFGPLFVFRFGHADNNAISHELLFQQNSRSFTKSKNLP